MNDKHNFAALGVMLGGEARRYFAKRCQREPTRTERLGSLLVKRLIVPTINIANHNYLLKLNYCMLAEYRTTLVPWPG